MLNLVLADSDSEVHVDYYVRTDKAPPGPPEARAAASPLAVLGEILVGVLRYSHKHERIAWGDRPPVVFTQRLAAGDYSPFY
jgi:hypothetical protein